MARLSRRRKRLVHEETRGQHRRLIPEPCFFRLTKHQVHSIRAGRSVSTYRVAGVAGGLARVSVGLDDVEDSAGDRELALESAGA